MLCYDVRGKTEQFYQGDLADKRIN